VITNICAKLNEVHIHSLHGCLQNWRIDCLTSTVSTKSLDTNWGTLDLFKNFVCLLVNLVCRLRFSLCWSVTSCQRRRQINDRTFWKCGRWRYRWWWRSFWSWLRLSGGSSLLNRCNLRFASRFWFGCLSSSLLSSLTCSCLSSLGRRICIIFGSLNISISTESSCSFLGAVSALNLLIGLRELCFRLLLDCGESIRG